MRTNLAIAALIFPMIQAVLFGIGLLAVLALGPSATLIFGMIAATFLVSAPVALALAPRLRSQAWRRRTALGSGPSKVALGPTSPIRGHSRQDCLIVRTVGPWGASPGEHSQSGSCFPPAGPSAVRFRLRKSVASLGSPGAQV